MGLIYLDSCLLIYAIENHGELGDKTRAAIDETEEANFAISPLVKLECLVKPVELGNIVLQRHYEAAFDTMVTLQLTEAVFTVATQLRARFGMRTPDALHVACAQLNHCDALWSNDSRLVKATHGLAINILT